MANACALQPGDLLRQRVAPGTVDRRRTVRGRRDVERDRRGVDARHPADEHGEVAYRLRRAERVRDARNRLRRSFDGAAGAAAVGEPVSRTPDATTLYSAGTVMRMWAVA